MALGTFLCPRSRPGASWLICGAVGVGDTSASSSYASISTRSPLSGLEVDEPRWTVRRLTSFTFAEPVFPDLLPKSNNNPVAGDTVVIVREKNSVTSDFSSSDSGFKWSTPMFLLNTPPEITQRSRLRIFSVRPDSTQRSRLRMLSVRTGKPTVRSTNDGVDTRLGLRSSERSRRNG